MTSLVSPHPLDGAFITTESLGNPDPEARRAMVVVGFSGEGSATRAHAARDYLDALVKADRAAGALVHDAPPLQAAAIPSGWCEALLLLQTKCPEAIIAGGALRDLDNGRPVKDLDIFVTGNSDLDLFSLRRWLAEDCGEICDEIDPQKMYPIDGGNDVIGFFEAHFDGVGVPAQIIMLRPSEQIVLERMDYGICRMTFDGVELVRGDDYEKDKREQVFRLRVDRGALGLAASVHRFARLQAKYPGWSFVPFNADPFGFAVAK